MAIRTIPARELEPGDTIRYAGPVHVPDNPVRWVTRHPGEFVTAGFDYGIRHLRPDLELEIER